MKTFITTVKRMIEKPQPVTSKTDYVLNMMLGGEGVNQYKLYQKHFYEGAPMPTRLSSIIFNLKKKHNVKKRTIKYTDKATGKVNTYAEYYI